MLSASDPDAEYAFVYDNLGRVIQITQALAALTPPVTFTYQYDAAGNRTAKFIDANQNGQLDARDTDITQYTWDHRNRVVKVEHRAGYAAAVDRVIENAYDYQNRWWRRRLDADGDGHTNQRRIFAYDGSQVVLDFWRNNSQDLQIGHLRQRYLWGPAVDQILAEEAVDGGTDDLVQWMLRDHLNTVRDIAEYDLDADMTTVVNHLVYDAFGSLPSRRRQPAVRTWRRVWQVLPVSPRADARGFSAARPWRRVGQR